MLGAIISVILAFLFVCLGVFFLLGYIYARKIVRPNPTKKNKLSYLNGEEYQGEEWVQSNYDGKSLRASFFVAKPKSHRYVIVMPSYYCRRTSMYYLVDTFLKHKINVLCIDYAYSRKSVKNITFGINESEEFARWSERILGLDNKAIIGVLGEGVGANSAMVFASGFLDAEYCVACSPIQNFSKKLDSKIKFRPFSELVKWWVAQIAHFYVEQISIRQPIVDTDKFVIFCSNNLEGINCRVIEGKGISKYHNNKEFLARLDEFLTERDNRLKREKNENSAVFEGK